jgi:hypothetical protein
MYVTSWRSHVGNVESRSCNELEVSDGDDRVWNERGKEGRCKGGNGRACCGVVD